MTEPYPADNPLTEFFEPSGTQTEVLYSPPLREITYRVAQLNVSCHNT